MHLDVKTFGFQFSMNELICSVKARWTTSNVIMTVRRRDIRFPIYLRYRTSDIPTYKDIMIDQDYAFKVKKSPEVIVDAGANIGLASIYFANRHPESQIIAIEPEASNYEMLKMNSAPYGRIIPLNAAIWDKNEGISLVDPGLGKHGFMTKREGSQRRNPGKVIHPVRGITIDKIMREYGLKRIDILKMDIEGAEREVFRDPSAWIGKVNALIIELHERLKPGCNRSFYHGSDGFDEEWVQGDNVYFLSRRKYLMKA